ncbi:MAG: hypothetical protein LBG74_06535 [Spirochaetaceae bacterium]|jgi:hypothetical protein|nr:hypothetical protein [Spirochaetaceae bacterium]
MMFKQKRILAFAVLCAFLTVVFPPAASAQNAGVSAAQSAAGTEIKPSGFPQWAKDLRRGEIIAFGSFPFAWFLTILFTDLARSAAHDWQDIYWPWPLKPEGAVEMSTGEYGITLSIAAGISLIIAVTDHLILRNKRYYNRMREIQRPPAEPAVERVPLYPQAEDVPAEPPGQ